ncbi:MAG TPA: hypothetical protein VMM36_11475 [Opitutaceae bacterium]|nr:hypothetical protein [Opitutaceae bacterium]
MPLRQRHATFRGLRLAALALFGCIFTAAAVATEPTTPAPASTDPLEARGADEIRIREVFSSHLPGTMAKDAFRASLHPHFGDLDSKDHFRVSTGFRYGATSNLELSAEVNFYTSHGLGDISFWDEKGILSVEFGAKLNLGRKILKSWDSAIGFDAIIPLDDPPMELTDGLKHFDPYVTFSKRLQSRPNVRLFWGVGLDLVQKTSFPGVLGDNQLDDDSVHASAGFVFDRNYLHYTFETLVATTRGIGETDEDLLVLRPGIIWEVPSFRDRTRRSNWMVGFGGKVSIGPDGTDYGGSMKLRYNLDLKDLFRRGGKGE